LRIVCFLAICITFFSRPARADCEMTKQCASCNSGAFQVSCKCVTTGAPANTSFSCACSDGANCTTCGSCSKTITVTVNGGPQSETHTNYAGCSGSCPANTRLSFPKARLANAFFDQDRPGGGEVSQQGRRIEFRVDGLPLDVLDPVADIAPKRVSNLSVSVRNLSARPITGMLVRWSLRDSEGTLIQPLSKVDSLLGGHDTQPNEYLAISSGQDIQSKKPIVSVTGEVVYIEFADGDTAWDRTFARYCLRLGGSKPSPFRRRLPARARRINFGDGGISAGRAYSI
jgi:hypothetical protein